MKTQESGRKVNNPLASKEDNWIRGNDMLKEKVQKIMDQAVMDRQNAGCSLLVLKDGEEVLYCQSGYADVVQKKNIERDTIFQIFSMTKPITATAVMSLVEEGKLSLLEPVSAYLPGFKNQKVVEGEKLVPVECQVYIRDLMNMTGGLVYPENASLPGKTMTKIYDEIEKSKAVTTIEAANRFGTCPLLFQPGRGWQYSVSADVLGGIVELVSGMKYGEFLKERIFEPLGMVDTDFYVPKEKQSRLAKTYSSQEGGILVEEKDMLLAISGQMEERPNFESGGAGLASTIDDYARFGTMLLNMGMGNGHQILRPRTVEFLTNGGLNEIQQRDFERKASNLSGYTYGNMMRVLNTQKNAGFLGSEGSYGWDGAKETWFCNSPKEKMTILFMVQNINRVCVNVDLRGRLYNVIMSELGEL